MELRLSVSGKKGECKKVSMSPAREISIAKVVATDTHPHHPGYGTRVRMITIDGKPQKQRVDTLTAFFADGTLGSNIRMDSCPAGGVIECEVVFIEDCMWFASLHGAES